MTPIVYTKPGCGGCIATHRELNKKGIEYQEIDITKNPEVIDELAALGFQQMPVVNWNDEYWTGFRPDKIAQIHLGSGGE